MLACSSTGFFWSLCFSQSDVVMLTLLHDLLGRHPALPLSFSWCHTLSSPHICALDAQDLSGSQEAAGAIPGFHPDTVADEAAPPGLWSKQKLVVLRFRTWSCFRSLASLSAMSWMALPSWNPTWLRFLGACKSMNRMWEEAVTVISNCEATHTEHVHLCCAVLFPLKLENRLSFEKLI